MSINPPQPLPPHQSLREKRKRWLDVLFGNDPHSINQQLAQLSWDAAVYCVVNEARRLAPPIDPSDPSKGVQLNRLTHLWFDRGFFTNQMAGIRRVSDSSRSLDDRKGKGISSLPALIDDIINELPLLKRQTIFEAEDLEWDAKAMNLKIREFYDREKLSGRSVCSIPPNCSHIVHEMRHAQVDCLAGVDSINRQPTDQIREVLLKNLKTKISSACDDINEHVNKFIAHAATPESRANVTAQQAGVTLSQLWQAQRHLAEVAGFLSVYVLGYGTMNVFPIPQFDLLQYIERPLVDSSNLKALTKTWDDFHKGCNDWGNWGFDGYTREFGSPK